MATHAHESSSYEDGLELNRDFEGLQHKAGHSTATQPGLQCIDEPNNLPYGKLGGHQQFTNGSATRRNPWGLRPLAFGLLVAGISALVVGAAVGGGVGGALSASHVSFPATTTVYQTAGATGTISTPSSTATSNIVDYSVAIPQDVQTIAWDCPSITSFTTNNSNPNQNFDVACGVDYYINTPAVQGGVVADIVGFIAYSAQDCMEACSYMNQLNGHWGFGMQCAGITFNRGMSASYASHGANCWLKNGMSANPKSCTGCLGASL